MIDFCKNVQRHNGRYNIQSCRVITYSQGVGKNYVVTIVRCIRTENFPLREIGTWQKVRYNGGYAVNWVRCNAIPLYTVLCNGTNKV